MSITQADAIAGVRARLDEPSSIYWTDTDLRRWINEVARDMARRTECLRGQYSQTAVAGTSEYTPAFTSTTHMYRVYRVEFIPDNQTLVYPLEYRDPNSADEIWGLSQMQTEGIPAIWTSWNTPPNWQLQVYPSPSVAGDLKLWYYRLPTTLAIVDTSDQSELVEVVEGWEDVLIDGVEYKAKRRDGDSGWQEAKTEYEQHLDAMRDATLRFTDAAGVVTTPSGQYIPTWLYGNADW